MADILDGVEITERGEGPVLLFIPGSFGTGAGWKSVIEHLGGGYRIVTTSLFGYGATAERRPLGNATMRQQTDVLDAIIGRIGGPVHIVGHSFGGLAALAHAVEGTIKPASLTLFEANPFALLRTTGDQTHSGMFEDMTRVYFAEFEAGQKEAARHVIDFYGGRGTFEAFPQKVRDYVIATTASNIRDWSSGATFAPSAMEFSNVAASTLIVRGGSGHPAMMKIAELLVRFIPGARLQTIAGGSHFLPATHAQDVAALIKGHVTGLQGA